MSNGYPIWWETTITIYNRYDAPTTDLVTWYKTVLTDCFWKASGDKVSIGQVTLDSKSVLCRIPKNASYMDKFEWEQLDTTDEAKSDYFTLGIGDIIVKGECSETIDEYTQGQRSSDLLEKYRPYQRCMEIEDLAINIGKGRNNEHYYVRGK